jgi:hypothetical protein
MRRFVEEADRGQWTLLPECLDDFIDRFYTAKTLTGPSSCATLPGIGLMVPRGHAPASRSCEPPVTDHRVAMRGSGPLSVGRCP